MMLTSLIHGCGCLLGEDDDDDDEVYLDGKLCVCGGVIGVKRAESREREERAFV